jgi:hypothetical protein
MNEIIVFLATYLISIRKIPATNSIPPTPLIKGGKGGSLIPKFKGNDIIAGLLITFGFQLLKKASTQTNQEVTIIRLAGMQFSRTGATGGTLVLLGAFLVLCQLWFYYFSD